MRTCRKDLRLLCLIERLIKIGSNGKLGGIGTGLHSVKQRMVHIDNTGFATKAVDSSWKRLILGEVKVNRDQASNHNKYTSWLAGKSQRRLWVSLKAGTEGLGIE